MGQSWTKLDTTNKVSGQVCRQHSGLLGDAQTMLRCMQDGLASHIFQRSSCAQHSRLQRGRKRAIQRCLLGKGKPRIDPTDRSVLAQQCRPLPPAISCSRNLLEAFHRCQSHLPFWEPQCQPAHVSATRAPRAEVGASSAGYETEASLVVHFSPRRGGGLGSLSTSVMDMRCCNQTRTGTHRGEPCGDTSCPSHSMQGQGSTLCRQPSYFLQLFTTHHYFWGHGAVCWK